MGVGGGGEEDDVCGLLWVEGRVFVDIGIR